MPSESRAPERSADGRWILIDGRRWRATDPSIPVPLRQELVDELMDRRRAVGTAQREEDDEAVADARRGVHLAKVALGERGEPWWEPTPDGSTERVAAAIVTLARHRGPTKSICPSDAARAVGGNDWRSLLPAARAAARDLANDGVVVIRQRGTEVDPQAELTGPIRISIPEPGQA